MTLITIFLQAESSGNPLIFFVLVFGVFWFFMIRPQVKKQKQERKFREEMKKGDKVVTTGGLHGKVVEISEKIVKIDVSNGMVLKFEKTCVSADLSQTKD
ncbi:preprotein translocase subunit YajC [Flavobacteriales bacterium]|jgi:preprotein translocase subunit YajC|nr:preprotein translocase subunit YajC [Flavobacteriales bacterium]MDB3926681.1 preprotein translocase subunit YajC [Flavobacteriales bacterium]MDG1190263.1 preprotein translocase subunit YajC [Flavobacteriales bacterium]|tara:strand:+ start:438 stop:737 length:300 start_codon:yes stop_codon:yes gene_type:complete